MGRRRRRDQRHRLMHGYAIANGAIVNAYGPAHTWPFAVGYGGIAVVFFVLGKRKSL